MPSCTSELPVRIYYLCTGNSARSQMAEYFTLHHAPAGTVQAASGGTDPQGVHPLTAEVMSELDIDLSRASSDLLDPDLLQKSDLVVTLCADARDSCPALPPQVSHRHWPLPDPASEPAKVENFRHAREQIEGYVISLLNELDLR